MFSPMRMNFFSASHARKPTKTEWGIVAEVEKLASQLESKSDKQLLSAATDLREAENLTEVAITTRGAALMREAVRRVTGMSYHKVQLLGGTILARGTVAEMATGEGKTIVTGLPVYLEVLRGRLVHVASPNAYLAQRDFLQLKPIFEFLGLTAAVLPEKHDDAIKQRAYACDVVYGTGYEFGFDFLRDELARRAQPKANLGDSFLGALRGQAPPRPRQLQRGHGTAVIDEIDSVLIDEAMTPLVLSGGSPGEKTDPRPYLAALQIADRLQDEVDYHLDRTKRSASLTVVGVDRVHDWLGELAKSALRRPWTQYIEQSLTAREFFRAGVDFVVREGEVQIVDQMTGRIFTERSWRAGLHQAVEVRAGVRVTAEKDAMARITRQRFTRLYERRCGLTGTAAGAEREFHAMYQLPVVLVPRNLECRRTDLADRFFPSRDRKFQAIVEETRTQLYSQRPVLIGTRTIEDSVAIASLLSEAGISHQVLNGLQDADEAAIVAEAGEPGRVTVATNMAGRGTDIKPAARSLAVGGLHVIGVERNFSQRVDRQLAGRAGRQGNPGSCQFFLSADDDLIERHGPKFAQLLRKSAACTGEPQASWQSEVDRLQADLERKAYESRLGLVRQDKWLDGVLQTLVGDEAA